MNSLNKNELLAAAKELKIDIYEPFAEFLQGSPEETHFSLSLLDCYRAAGHACHSMTGAFLSTAEAVKRLYPKTNRCVRGDLLVEFGSPVEEKASGPRANLIGYLTGAYGETGFPGLQGRFTRKNLLRFAQPQVPRNAIRFTSLESGRSVDVVYDPGKVLEELQCKLDFPEKWRVEVAHVLKNRDRVISVAELKPATEAGSCGSSGCC
jgi:hypothetical protein